MYINFLFYDENFIFKIVIKEKKILPECLLFSGDKLSVEFVGFPWSIVHHVYAQNEHELVNLLAVDNKF